MLDYLLYIAGTILIVMYGAFPLLMRSQQKFPEQYDLVSFPVDEFLSESDESFKSLSSQISASGFHPVAASAFNHQSTDTRFLVFVHDEKKISILLVQITAQNIPINLYIDISQLFNDNTVLNIMNSPMPEAYPKSSIKVSFRFPEVTEVAPLIEITERIIKHYLSSKTAISLPKGEELKAIEKFLNDELAELISKGYVQNSVQNHLRSLTFKGAYLMTWKFLWPIKQIRESRELAFAKKILSQSV